MATRSEREKAQKLNEQHQAVLSELLRREDNKLCADCEAKGPRWASWNLGVFMCIRCAGIHRNLGVHISRVKSVNLDQWTPEQIQSMVEMGNTRARQLYEARLPVTFRRPQTDQAVEVFIRDKYERKKFYSEEVSSSQKTSDATPPPTSPSSQTDGTKPEKERDKKNEEKKKEADKIERQNNSKAVTRTGLKMSPEPAVDLLGLDAPEGGGKDLDTVGPMVSSPLPPSSTKQDQTDSAPTTASSTPSSRRVEKKLLSKDSILSLYGSQPQNQQQPAGQGAFVGQLQVHLPPQGCAVAGGTATMMGGGAMIPLSNGGYMQQGGSAANQNQQSLTQMTQQTSNMAVSSGGPPASGQTLSTQLWK